MREMESNCLNIIERGQRRGIKSNGREKNLQNFEGALRPECAANFANSENLGIWFIFEAKLLFTVDGLNLRRLRWIVIDSDPFKPCSVGILGAIGEGVSEATIFVGKRASNELFSSAIVVRVTIVEVEVARGLTRGIGKDIDRDGILNTESDSSSSSDSSWDDGASSLKDRDRIVINSELNVPAAFVNSQGLKVKPVSASR